MSTTQLLGGTFVAETQDRAALINGLFLEDTATTDGTGLSTGTSTVTGVGASLKEGIEITSGEALVTGVGSSIASGVGASYPSSLDTNTSSIRGVLLTEATSDVATLGGIMLSGFGAPSAQGVGASIVAGTGVSAGSLSAVGVGASLSYGAGAAAGLSELSGVASVTFGVRRARSIRILCLLEFATVTSRLWDGSGPYVDNDGDIWRGCGLLTGLDTIEQALNGEAYTLSLMLSGVGSTIADLAWVDHEAGEILGATVKIMIQPCDERDQPIGSPDVKFYGTIDNVIFEDGVSGDEAMSSVTAECTNRFALRRRKNGAVLSDTDQRARSAAVNPLEAPDQFCERVQLQLDKTITWPRWN